MKKNKITVLSLIAGGMLMVTPALAQQQKSVKLTTANAVGTPITLVVNTDFNGVTVDWGDNNPVTYTAEVGKTELALEGTVKGSVITVSGGEQWDMLNCAGCGLTAIDLTQARKLRSLYCQNNQIASLDLREMSSLTDLDCSNNKLSELIFSNPTYPENDLSNIENLNLSDNELTGTFVVRTSTLQQLNVSGNPLTTLYVSSNPNLSLLNCSDNDVRSISLSANKNLQTLIIRNSGTGSVSFPSTGLPQLQQAILENTSIPSLDLTQSTQLSDLQCNNNGMTSLRLPSNLQLDNLDLRHNNLDFRSLPRRNSMPVNLRFLPQADVDIAAAAGMQETGDGTHFVALCPSWADRTNENYMLDLTPWRYIGVNAESDGTVDVSFTWYAVDENGNTTELTQGRSQSAPNDFYASGAKFAFFTGQSKIFATMSSRTYDFTLNTIPFSVGEDYTTGITGVSGSEDGLSVRTAGGKLYMSSAQPIQVNVYSLDGRTVWSGTVGNSKESVSLPKGVYVVNNQKVAL